MIELGVDQRLVAGHLARRYRIEVEHTSALDAGVFRVERRDGPDWVARVFGPERPVDDVEAEAAILDALQERGFPAERCAGPAPVSGIDGHSVLVTEYVTPAAPVAPGRSAAILGSLLGRLHSHGGERLRAGGAWHHLSPVGGPREEVAAALALLDASAARVVARERAPYDRLREAAAGTDDCHDLPHAFVHPDFVPANAIPTSEQGLVIVDWTGSGRGPRLWSLGFLLWASGARSSRLVELVVSRYRRHVTLSPPELDRLSGAIRGRAVMLECWAYCAGRRSLAAAVERIDNATERAERIAAVARRAFESAGL